LKLEWAAARQPSGGRVRSGAIRTPAGGAYGGPEAQAAIFATRQGEANKAAGAAV
jgi:hypothetical protein